MSLYNLFHYTHIAVCSPNYVLGYMAGQAVNLVKRDRVLAPRPSDKLSPQPLGMTWGVPMAADLALTGAGVVSKSTSAWFFLNVTGPWLVTSMIVDGVALLRGNITAAEKGFYDARFG